MRLVRDSVDPRTFQAQMMLKQEVKSDIQNKVAEQLSKEGRPSADIEFSVLTDESPIPIEEYVYSKIDL